MTIRTTITATIIEVAAQHHKTLGPLTDALPLLDSGLDSLCIAVVVALLGDRLGLEPFASRGDNPLPVTVGDFIALYENAAR